MAKRWRTVIGWQEAETIVEKLRTQPPAVVSAQHRVSLTRLKEIANASRSLSREQKEEISKARKAA